MINGLPVSASLAYVCIFAEENESGTSELNRGPRPGPNSRTELPDRPSPHPGRTLAKVARRTRIWKRALENKANGASAMVADHHRSNSGRKKKDYSNELAQLHTFPTQQRKTYRSASYRINMPRTTLWRRCTTRTNEEEGPRRHTIHQKPILTAEQQRKRIDYAIGMVDNDGNYFRGAYDVVHVDEKWFNMYEPTYSCILGPGEASPQEKARNKRYIGKCMFLCAVARPRYCPQEQKQFDGKIGIWPMVRMVAAQRTSRNRPAGTLEMKAINVTSDVYKDYFVNEIIPAIDDKWPLCHRNRPIYIQHDNATSHSALSPTDQDLLEAIQSTGMDISFLVPGQAPNSPDTNVLDLGFFRSIEALQQQKRTHQIEELVEWTEECFNEMSHETLNKVFLTHQTVCEQIILHGGTNSFKIPHMKKDQLARNGVLPTRIRLSDEAKQKIQEYQNPAPGPMEGFVAAEDEITEPTTV